MVTSINLKSTPSTTQVFSFLKKFGWNSLSFQILKRGFLYEYTEDSCIGYVDTGSAWVAAGDPITPPDQQLEVALRFVSKAKTKKRRSAFFIAQDFTLSSPLFKKIYIGDEVFLDATTWQAEVQKHKSFKEQLRRARAKGVTVEYVPATTLIDEGSDIRQATDRLVKRWRSAKHMDTMGFLVDIEPFTYTRERLYFIARQQGKIIGFLVGDPIYKRNGWFLEHIFRDPEAFNGTAETLIHVAVTEIHSRGQKHVSLGLTPLYKNVRWSLKIFRSLFQGFYNFKGLRTFKQRLPTAIFEPRYLLLPSSQSLFLTFTDIARSFVPQGWPSFIWNTVIRLPPPLWSIFTVIALVWAALLANLDTDLWFPSRAVQVAWVIFDLCAGYAFWHLHYGIKRKFLIGLAIIIGFDALLTVIQVLAFNSFQTYTYFQYGVIVLGISAPILTGILLWTNVFYARKLT